MAEGGSTGPSLIRNEEQKSQKDIGLVKVKDLKMKAIATARQLWETLCQNTCFPIPQDISSAVSIDSAIPLHILASRLNKEKEDMFCLHCGGKNINCSECKGGNPDTQSRVQKQSQYMRKKKIRPLTRGIADSKLTYLAAVECENLELYGPGAVAAAIRYRWAPEIVSLIHTVSFHFVVFDDIFYLLGKLKTKFPNIEAASFECACLECLTQLNALGQIPDLKKLTIETEGNPILQLSLWRTYAVYRLSPTIEEINGSLVTDLEINNAEDIFGGVGFATALLLPKYRLTSLINNPRVKKAFVPRKDDSPNHLQRKPSFEAANEVIKATYTYNPNFELPQPGDKMMATEIVDKNWCAVQNIIKKKEKFKRVWPSLYVETINDALENV